MSQDTKEFIEGAICFIIVVTILFGGMCLLNWDNMTVHYK